MNDLKITSGPIHDLKKNDVYDYDCECVNLLRCEINRAEDPTRTRFPREKKNRSNLVMLKSSETGLKHSEKRSPIVLKRCGYYQP